MSDKINYLLNAFRLDKKVLKSVYHPEIVRYVRLTIKRKPKQTPDLNIIDFFDNLHSICILKKENKSTKNILVISVNIFRLSSLSIQTKLTHAPLAQ